MKEFVNFPPVKNIFSRFSPSGEAYSSNEFLASYHSQRELLFVLRGTFRYMMNDSVYTMTPGSVALISPGQNHACGYREIDNDLLHLWVFIHDKGMHGIIAKVFHGVHANISTVKKPIMFSHEMKQLILKRWTAFEEFDKKDDLTVKQFMQIPLELILNEVQLQLNNFVSSDSNHSVSWFIQSYIRNCNGRFCTLEKLAEITGYSPSHISHSFQKEYGMSIGDFIDEVRVEYVSQALSRNIKHKIIAEELGFSSAKAFWNWKQKFPELQKK